MHRRQKLACYVLKFLFRWSDIFCLIFVFCSKNKMAAKKPAAPAPAPEEETKKDKAIFESIMNDLPSDLKISEFHIDMNHKDERMCYAMQTFLCTPGAGRKWSFNTQPLGLPIISLRNSAYEFDDAAVIEHLMKPEITGFHIGISWRGEWNGPPKGFYAQHPTKFKDGGFYCNCGVKEFVVFF